MNGLGKGIANSFSEQEETGRRRVFQLLCFWIGTRVLDLVLSAWSCFYYGVETAVPYIMMAVTIFVAAGFFKWIMHSRQAAILPMIGGVLTVINALNSIGYSFSYLFERELLIVLISLEPIILGFIQTGIMLYLYNSRVVRPYYEVMEPEANQAASEKDRLRQRKTQVVLLTSFFIIIFSLLGLWMIISLS